VTSKAHELTKYLGASAVLERTGWDAVSVRNPEVPRVQWLVRLLGSHRSRARIPVGAKVL